MTEFISAKEKKFDQLMVSWAKAQTAFKANTDVILSWSRPSRWSEGIWEEDLSLLQGQIGILISLREKYYKLLQEDEE